MDMTMMQSDQHLHEYIHKLSVNERVNYHLADNHQFEAGVRSELYSVNSAEIVTNGILQKDIRAGLSNALWLAYEGSVGPVGIDAGLRLSALLHSEAHASIPLWRPRSKRLILRQRPTSRPNHA